MTKRTSDDGGFSLVEVIIAMFLFLVIATALLPLTMRAVALSADNRALAAANTLASSRLADLRDAFGDDAPSTSCADVQARQHSDVADPAPTGLVSDLAVAACPSAYPGTVTATVAVRNAGEPGVIATIPTRIVVGAP